MRSRRLWQSAACALLLPVAVLAAHAGDGTVQTGWMELIKGSRDSTVGAEVVEVEAGDTADTQKITLAIPKQSIANPGDIEEVVVIGQRPEKPEKPEPLDITFEWAGDYDSENYGLVIRLSRNTNWPIRLYMNSDPGFVR
jgi:hypothetical protein